LLKKYFKKTEIQKEIDEIYPRVEKEVIEFKTKKD